MLIVPYLSSGSSMDVRVYRTATWLLLLMLLLLLPLLQVTMATEGLGDPGCPTRGHSNPPGRMCKKSCFNDDDCKSKKKVCKCDGECGRSCIKHKQRCHELRNISNGRVTIVPSNQFGAIARYHCNDSYILRGNPARVCQGDETWSGVEPQCFLDKTIAPVTCSSPPEVHNAVHDGSVGQTTFSLGIMLLYSCLPGYKIQRDGVVRAWCVGGGVWVGPNMSCSHAGCPALDNIDNGRVDQEPANNIGSKATYHCKAGYFLAGRAERICDSNGHWGGVQPSCEKVTCGPPPMIENAQHDGDEDQQRFPSGQQLTYTCVYGYYKVDSDRAMCSGDGQWIGLTLTCSPKSCGFPGDVENGWRKGFSFTYPSKVSYTCHDGFELQGYEIRTCQANGLWSGDVPICQPVSCPELSAPVYGRMLKEVSGSGYGIEVEFVCDDGYKVLGSKKRRCQADRSWSGRTAKCVEINCGWPSPFYNGYLIGHKTTVGSTIFFSCITRATFDGPAFQTLCQENGEWSQPPPKCWGQCKVPHIEDATLVEGRELMYVDHNTPINFKCEDGLQPRGGSVIRCNNGSWSQTPECIPAPCLTTPPHVHNGMRIFMGQDHGFKAKYKCFSGYKLTGMNSSYLTCTYGEWIGGRPHCKEFYCSSPTKIEHGQIFKKGTNGLFIFQPYITRIRHGHKLEYRCDPNYRIVGPGGATCVNGEWQPPLTNPGTKCEPAIHPPFKKLWSPINNIRKS